MKLTPYEQVLNFEHSSGLDDKRPKFKRSKNGCLVCRKRKRKCDEMRPNCSLCLEKNFQCVWPGHESTKEEPKPPKNDEKITSIPMDGDPNNVVFDLLDTINGAPKSSQLVLLDDNFQEFNNDLDEGELDAQDYVYSLDQENIPDDEFSLSLINHFTQDQEQKFMCAFANGFLDSVNPQYTHPLLTAVAAFTPFVYQNPIIEKVAIAAGATYLSWQNPSLLEVSSKKHSIALSTLRSYMRETQHLSNHEDWLAAAIQLMCLCSKFNASGSSSDCTLALVDSYKIIRTRFTSSNSKESKKSKGYFEGYELDVNDGPHDFISDLRSDNLKMEVKNSQLIEASTFASHFEKVYLESFIYNYSVTLLVAEDYYLLPSPFEVFKEIRFYLKTPIVNCDVAWMNNPVFGASLEAYELATKASYLTRNMHNPMVPIIAKNLYDLASFYTPPMIPSAISVGSKKYQDLRASVLMAEIIAKVTKILLRKIVIPEITAHDPVIQKDLNQVIDKFRSIFSGSKVKGISCFPCLIAGAACVTDAQKRAIVQALKDVATITHGSHIYTVVSALNISWGMGPESQTNQTRGLDILFDNRILRTVIL